MTLEHYALLAEIVGGIAVLITLIFFVIEIRKNTDAVRSSTHQQQVETTVAINSNVTNDSALASLIVRANNDFESLAHDERLKLDFFYTNYFNMWNYQYRNSKKEIFDHDAWHVWSTGMTGMLNSHVAMRATWSSIRPIYSPEFRNYVDATITRLGPIENETASFVMEGE